MAGTQETISIADAQGLLAQARLQLQAIEAERHRLIDKLQHKSEGFQKLEAARQRLTSQIATTEALLAVASPGHFGPAGAPPGGVPDWLAELPRFTRTLGLPGTRGAVSSGEEVERLQRILRWQGADLPVDGQFGATTRKALIAWQGTRHLAQDGVVGAATRQVLNALLGTAAPT